MSEDIKEITEASLAPVLALLEQDEPEIIDSIEILAKMAGDK